MRSLALLTVVVSSVAFAGPNPKIAEARKQFEDLELEKAARTLASAEATPGNDRKQVLEILELQGIVYGTWNKDAKARDAFRELLTLNPDFKLGGEHPPRVRTPFYEAKGWVVDNAPLQVEGSATFEERVSELKVTVKKDSLRLVKGARFVVLEGADPTPREVPFSDSVATLEVDGAKVVWKVELLGQHQATLLELGPFTHAGSDAPVAAVVEPAKPVPEVSQPVSATGGWMKPTSYVLFGVGTAALVTGAVFGVMSSDGRSRVTNAATSPTGLITSITQRESALVEKQSMQQAVIANVLFGAGGALAATGALFFFLAPSTPPPVTVLVSPSGVSVAGAWP